MTREEEAYHFEKRVGLLQRDMAAAEQKAITRELLAALKGLCAAMENHWVTHGLPQFLTRPYERAVAAINQAERPS